MNKNRGFYIRIFGKNVCRYFMTWKQCFSADPAKGKINYVCTYNIFTDFIMSKI